MATENTPKRIYKDIDMSFKPNVLTKDIGKKFDVNAVKQSLKNVLLTQKGEKPFNPNYGSGIYDLLFEPMDYLVSSVMQKEIETTIENYEPRVELIDVECEPNFDLEQYEIRIEFYVIGVKEPQVYTNVLQRLR
jgi:phage baseplate assembly protein W